MAPTPARQDHALFAVVLLCVAAVALPGQAIAAGTHIGNAYRIDNGTLAYREQHLLFEEAGKRGRLVLYTCPAGAAFARKVVIERGDPVAPDFDLLDARTGYREGVRTTGSGREAFVRASATAPEKTRRLESPLLP